MVAMSSQNEAPTSVAEMIPALAKTFAVSHEGRSDAQIAQALVFNAGRLAWRMRDQGLNVEEKTSISDVVTEADRAAESFIHTALALLRPEDGVIGEEGTNQQGTSGRTWVVDPVDGTFNFTTGGDYWCSALALVSGDPSDPEVLHLGAVHRADLGYTWLGGKDLPTTRDGKKLPKLDSAPLADISLGTYIHPTFLAKDEVREAWLKVATACATLRMFGAASVDLAGVAEGRIGVWMQHSVHDWDWLPGRALVEGAGGACEKVEAGGVTWCIAGNAQAVREAQAALTA
ncbi:Inositol-1-monophosphatase [Corynebacterium pelargi]|uniref:Inositol-1-monophosphatase n=2 Tax=Corynebacterium pelargi TaxID=1471400 RepID=A0A410WAC0_9CORY|nr:Inositol-1-monophosphatase [Corynebacterium pelargi]